MEANYGKETFVLPYIAYSDETCVTIGDHSFHPVTIVLCMPLHLMRRQHAHKRIAYLPIIKGSDLGMSSTADKTEYVVQ